jgi:hypothetical protein
MTTYSQADYEAIGKAIPIADLRLVARQEKRFEGAALWYRLSKRRNKGTPPSKLRGKLERVGRSAHRLLETLGVPRVEEAPDGPGDQELLEALVLEGDANEDRVVEATRQIGRLVEILGAIEAANEIARRARAGAEEVKQLGQLTMVEGNSGDAAVNDWIAAMMGIYLDITGKKPATSVGGPNQPNEGTAGGPLIRFLRAAGKPLGIQYGEDAWRSRVRTILKTPAQN